jgi:hypothetical protein
MKEAYKMKREGDVAFRIVTLSFQKWIQARSNEDEKTTRAASQNASLKIAPSGSKNGSTSVFPALRMAPCWQKLQLRPV